MTRLNCQTIHSQTHLRIMVLLLIFALCLISFDAAFAQTTNPPNKHRDFRINGKAFKHQVREKENARSNNCGRLPNRIIDGTCNNIDTDETVDWGASDIDLYRSMNAAYGVPDFYNEMSGNCRLTPRAISNLVVAQSEDLPSPRNLSSLVFTWGQFIDHDIDLTPEGDSEYVPILLPSNEPLFTSPIPFLRSEPYTGSGVTDDRQQQNLITSWLDASQVYGSEESRANWLRTFNRGKLKVSEGGFLPYNTIDGNLGSTIDPNAPSMAGDNGGTVEVFVAGDVRANEQAGLTVLHTLFVREHNRICDRRANQGFTNDEQNYQFARKRIGAYIQAITYNDFLPALGVHMTPYSGYNSNVQPDITNIFATAAYRLGHTMVTDEFLLLDTDCHPIGSGSLPLLDGFFNPSVVSTYGLEAFLQGLASQRQQKVDAQIVDNLRNFLFGDPNSESAFGLDLASLNIQRGRDHGLPDYNSARAHYTGSSVENFSDITTDVNLQNALEAAYGSVYDMDLWVGLLSETPLMGSSIGITLNAILAKQFEQLRTGDFYFYKNDPALSRNDKNQIDRITLKEIITRNTQIDALQNNVFFAATCNSNGGGGGPGPGPGGPGGPGAPSGGGENSSQSLDSNTNLGINANNSLTIYPSPTDGIVNVNILLEKQVQKAIVKVQNLEGKVFFQETTDVFGNAFYYKMNLKHLPKGMYFITVLAGEELFSEKFVLER